MSDSTVECTCLSGHHVFGSGCDPVKSVMALDIAGALVVSDTACESAVGYEVAVCIVWVVPLVVGKGGDEVMVDSSI